ncbi:hypothetical protein ACWEQL_28890 [Kitasatospora sp. NPDC004240]
MTNQVSSFTDALGATYHLTRDPAGRLESLDCDAVQLKQEHDGQGRLARWTATDKATGAVYGKSLSYDANGRTTTCVFSGPGAERTVELAYNAQGALTSRRLTAEGALLLGEALEYDERQRLVRVGYDGARLLTDMLDRQVSRIEYEFDPRHSGGARTGSTTTFTTGEPDRVTFHYGDSFRLTHYEHDNGPLGEGHTGRVSVDQHYDVFGKCLTATNPDVKLTYDEQDRFMLQGRLTEAADPDPSHDFKETYRYGTDGLLEEQSRGDRALRLHYRDGLLAHEVTDGFQLTYLRADGDLIGWVERHDGEAARFAPACTDPWGTVVAVHDGTTLHDIHFLPHGSPLVPYGHPALKFPVVFQGMLQNLTTRLYLTPTGRPYNPVTGRWLTPAAVESDVDPYPYKNHNPFQTAP